jgi:5-methyltetrahydrofolate--homocysteine methyltransferase
VLDASRAVGVVASLLDPKQRADFDRRNREEQARLRDAHAAKAARPLASLAAAEAGRLRLEWRAEDLATPEFVGRRVLDDVPLAEIVRYIDWRFFFTAWELPGRFPQVLDDPTYGEAARDLYANATALLERIVAEKLLVARAVYGFWPAASEGDDVVVFEDGGRERLRFAMLRQQAVRPAGQPYLSLADFVAPAGGGLRDHVGAFAVTAGIGVDALVARFEAEHDDYDAIMVKALADRLAEALAEWLHERVRREWGFGRDQHLTLDEILKEKYRSIRPAFGYPACPDHTEKRKLFELLAAPAVGITLTEHFAMLPAASVSGLYLAHPAARYFPVGRIGRDQAAAYARRKGMTLEEAERWLAPNLGYDPKKAAAPAAA